MLAKRISPAGRRVFPVASAVTLLICLVALAGGPAAHAAGWTTIDAAGQQILDVDADRLLYLDPRGTFDAPGTIVLRDRDTDAVTPIGLPAGANPYGGFLTPYGAVVAATGTVGVGGVYEWRGGTVTRLGSMSGLHLKAAGTYVLWGDLQNPSFGPLHLFRRDLETGTTIQLTTEGSSGGEHDEWDDWASNDLAANGDVAMWTFDGIFRWRNGVTTELDPGGDATSGYASFPRTDGTNVVWRRRVCCMRGSLRGYGPSGGDPEGEFILDEFAFTESSTKEPAPDHDYRVNGGWTAFTVGAEGAEAVWTRDPSGAEAAVSPPGGYEIVGLAADGEVVYGNYVDGNNVNSFLARPGEEPVELGKAWGNQLSGRGFGNHVFKTGGRWYSVAFGSLRRAQLTDAAVDGSRTQIDGGPQGTDEDDTPTFAFSSPVAGATFQCKLDAGGWTPCTSPHTLPPLDDGVHTFLVRSVAPGGDVDPEPASQTWTVDDDDDPPGEFALLAPAPGATTTDSTPTFTWEPAADADHYSVWIDGNHAVDVATTHFTPGAPLPEGTHSWRIDAVDANGNVRSSAERSFGIDSTAPTAALGASPNPVLTGDAVVLDAAGSSDPNGGSVVRYEWDLDGDGGFERDTGSTSSTSTTYPARGDVQPAVRVTDAVGHTATASTSLSVRQSPPAGPAGVSINDGARFTNDADVTVRVVWPALATTVLLSNDGGFREAGRFPVTEEIPWRIDSAGSGRLPQTIYARFEGAGGRETYQDDIVFDGSPPRVIVLELASTVSASSVRGAAAKRAYRLRIKGRDTISGIGRMQITTDRRKPGAARPYRNFAVFRARSSRIYARLQDRAGNWSSWKRVER